MDNKCILKQIVPAGLGAVLTAIMFNIDTVFIAETAE